VTSTTLRLTLTPDYEGLLAEGDDRRLVSLVHPPDWTNPAPPRRYDLVVIGGGTAGLVCALGAAALGAKVALCEKALLGGDCLVSGCVPSKALLHSAHLAHDVQEAAAFGVETGDVEVDFAAVLERVRRLRADIAPHDAAQRAQEAGVDVHLAEARFVAQDAVECGGQTLRFRRAVIASGRRPKIPTVPGLETAGYLTHATLFGLTRAPPRLAVLGGGPVGCELAQGLARLGMEVTLVQDGPRLLPRDDPEASDVLARVLQEELQLWLGAQVTRVESSRRGKVVHALRHGEALSVEVDEILVATGHAPMWDGLGLEAAGIRLEAGYPASDEHLRTSNSRVYVAGDAAGRWAFTHAADAMARLVLQNALFLGKKRVSALSVPWCTYTDPEVAHVGLGAEEAYARGQEVVTLTTEMGTNDRAVLDEQTQGFARIHAEARTGRVLGATLVSRHAGESIGEAVLAVRLGLKLGALADTIHPYPTQAEAWKRLGDMWNARRLTPGARALLKTVLTVLR
jgi:pyruvate/2-oxoglutarate dehydrogenase complex dihydrolipoamide dehydrogenase (E3) component